MNNDAVSIARAEQKRRIRWVTLISILYIAIIGYVFYSWEAYRSGVHEFIIGALIGFQLFPTALIIAPQFSSKRLSWWKVSCMLTAVHWTGGILLGVLLHM